MSFLNGIGRLAATGIGIVTTTAASSIWSTARTKNAPHEKPGHTEQPILSAVQKVNIGGAGSTDDKGPVLKGMSEYSSKNSGGGNS